MTGPTCPIGGEELEPHVRYCWAHQCYVDEPAPDPERARVEKALDDAVLEEDVRAGTVGALRAFGYAVWDLEQGHRPMKGGTRQTKGLADLLVAGHGEVFFVELKRPGGKRRREQKTFQEEIEANGVRVYLWRSSAEAADHYEERRRRMES